MNRAPDNNKIDFGEISFQTEQEEKVLELLRAYGCYQNIENYLPYLENENEDNDMGLLFEKSFHDVNSMKLSESIINLTLRESQNLITKSSDLVTSVSDKLKVDPPKAQKPIEKSLDIHDNETKSIKLNNGAKVTDESKLRRNDTTTSSKKKTLKNISNLTLNNCNGSIVLKNISNLTINTCKQPDVKSTKGETHAPIKPCSSSKSCDGSFYQCDFYERLISENEVLKRSIVNQSLCTTYPDPIATACMSPPASTAAGKKDEREDECGTYSIVSTAGDSTVSSLDEAEDGLAESKIEKINDTAIEEITTKTMLPDNLMSHPPMIQCWLSKMLLETETEAQNFSEFLEISNII